MTKLLLSLILSCSAQAEVGKATWYGDECLGNKTANGEVWDPTKLTCASWFHPFNTKLKVTNLSNKRFVIVRVNDRGPAKRLVKSDNRVIDLSREAFKRIAPLEVGKVNVKVELVGKKGLK